MSVRRLDSTTINQIAAGEVIERPFSVVRELLDNSLDAGSGRIDITISDGGKTLIKVVDDGFGMSDSDLLLCVERHCTSKLDGGLSNITTLGFRGEALPSIGSVSRLRVSSRLSGSAEGWQVRVDGGIISPLRPVALNSGTIVEVSDLFYSTPARLKFLKGENSEYSSIVDHVRRISLAHPKVHFTLRSLGHNEIDYPSVSDFSSRISQVLGSEFIDNSVELDIDSDGIKLFGFCGLPTLNRVNSFHQFFYVNGRSVRDKILLGSVRTAYVDSVPRGRHPILVLFIDLDSSRVDVNVHPAKSEVRFYDERLVRSLITGSIKDLIDIHSRRSSSSVSSDLVSSFSRSSTNNPPMQNSSTQHSSSQRVQPPSGRTEDIPESTQPESPEFPTSPALVSPALMSPALVSPALVSLGSARAQIHKNYIIAQTDDGMIIVDQHAAHERILYERLKSQLSGSGIVSQLLLVPAVVDLSISAVSCLSDHLDSFRSFGLELSITSPTSITVLSTPSLLGVVDCASLLRDLSDDIANWGSSMLLEERIHYIAATLSCYGSIRSGRVLRPEEMDHLLRDMEHTPNSGQCNHGRPTYIELKLKDIERLFLR